MITSEKTCLPPRNTNSRLQTPWMGRGDTRGTRGQPRGPHEPAQSEAVPTPGRERGVHLPTATFTAPELLLTARERKAGSFAFPFSILKGYYCYKQEI